MEKVKIDIESFRNLKKMLRSPDEETVVTAICAMEHMDFHDNKMYMTLLYRESQQFLTLWQTHGPSIITGVNNLSLDDIMSIKAIYLKLKESLSPDEIKAFIEVFEEMSTKLMRNWGFGNMMDDFTIKIIRNE